MAIWKNIFRFFGLGLMVVLLLRLDGAQWLSLLRQGDPGWLLASVGLNMLFFIVKGVRWRWLLAMNAIAYPWRRAIPVYMAGSFLGAVTPGRVADLIKASYLHQDLALPYGDGVASVVMDRLLDLLVLALIALGVVFLGSWGRQYRWAVVVFLSLVLVVVAIFGKSSLLLTWSKVGGPRVHALVATWQGYHRVPLLLPLMLSFLAYGLLYGGGYCLAQGTSLPLDFDQVIYVMTLGNLVGLLPFSVAGIGTRDLAMILLFEELGLSALQGMTFSVGYLISNLLLGNSPGCLYWFWQPVERLVQTPLKEPPPGGKL